MKVILKILIGTVTVIPILIIAAVLIVPRVVDPNDYRDRISELVREQTSRNFGIDGDLSISIFPWVGVTAREMWLAQPDGLDGANMIEVGEVDLRVKLLPLLDRRVEVDTIVLVDPTVRIVRLEDGSSSFDGLTGAGESGESGPGAGDAAGAAAAIAVQGLELENGTFVWEDRATGQSYELRDLRVETGQLLTGAPGPFSISARLLDSTRPDPVLFEFEAIVSIDIENYSVSAEEMEATINQGDMNVAARIMSLHYEQAGGRLNLNGLVATVDLPDRSLEIIAPELALDLDQQTLDAPGFRVSMPTSILSGTVTVSEVFDDPVIVGSATWEDLESGQRYEITDLVLAPGQVLGGETDTVTAGGILTDSTSPDPLRFDMKGLVSIDSETSDLSVNNANVTLGRGAFRATSRIGTLRYGQATSQLNLTGLAAAVDLPDQSLEIAAPQLGFNLEQQLLDLPGFRVTMQTSVLSGTVTVSQVFDDPVIAGSLAWQDLESGQRYLIDDLELAPGQVLSGETDTVTAGGVLTDSASPDPLRFDVTGLVSIDSETSDVTVNDADVSIARDRMSVVSRIGTLRFEQASGRLNINGLVVTTDLEQVPVVISADTLTANLETQKLEIPELTIDIPPALLTASVSATQFIDNPGATGQLRAEDFNLAELLRNSGFDYTPADPEAMSAMSLSTVYSATPASIELSGLVGLDASTLAGSFSVDNFDAPVIRFDLSLNEINIDRYLPATFDEDAATQQQLQASAALLLPVALFRDLNANGSFNADSLVSGGMRVSNIDVQVVSDEDSVTVTPTAELYGGTVDGTLSYRNLGGREELIIRENIDNVRLGDFLADTGITDRVTGTGDLSIDLTVTEEGGVQSSRGQIGFAARNGQLRGVDIQKLVQQATALYYQARGRTLDPDRAPPGEGTQFSELTGTFMINNMILVNDDLIMKAPAFRVNGRGRIDLNRGELDYLASAAIVKSAEGQGGAERDDLRAIPIPVRCSGNISDPSCGLDVAELTREIAKQELSRKRGEIEEKILKEVGEEFNLEGLFDLLKN